MSNVNFHIDADIIMKVKKLRGELIPIRGNEYPVFDKTGSFILNIFSADISIDVNSLSKLLNRYVFGYDSSPLKDIKISIDGDHLKQEGKMKGIPFSILSKVSVTPDGKIKLHPEDIKTVGIDVSGLMKFFKIQLDELIKLNKNYGASVKDNDLYLDLTLILPPPKIKGHLTSIQIGKEEIIQKFSSDQKPFRLDSLPGNYMYYKGGELGFGKLTMHNADMLILDKDLKDPFDFFQEEYLKQLTAGYHVTTQKQGLIIYMPDYNDLKPDKENHMKN